MIYEVVLTPRAEADADDAAAYIRRFAPEAADRWLDGLLELALTLAEMPHRCAEAPEAQFFGVELRQILYGNRTSGYRVVFRVETEARIVRVVAVRYGARLPLALHELSLPDPGR